MEVGADGSESELSDEDDDDADDAELFREYLDECRRPGKDKMTWGDIARTLNMSAKTLGRRRKNIGYDDPSPFSIIDDGAMDAMMKQLVEDFPYKGYRCFQTLLLVRGHRVPRSRIEASLSRIDPLGKLFALIQLIIRPLQLIFILWFIFFRPKRSKNRNEKARYISESRSPPCLAHRWNAQVNLSLWVGHSCRNRWIFALLHVLLL